MANESLNIKLNTDGTFKEYARDTKGATKGTDALTKAAVKLGLAFISVEGARKAFDLAEESAKAKDVEKAFINLADSANIVANDMLASMKEATAGTIAEFELMQQFSTASLLGLPLDRFDEMLAIARGAAKATGQSMEFMLNSIVTALGRGSKLMLDNLGILIDVGAANERYADSLGKVSTQLTDVERKQAFINDALSIGSANLERIGELTDSDADAFARLAAETGNLAISMGESLLPVMRPVVDAMTFMAVQAREIIEEVENVDRVTLSWSDTLSILTATILLGRGELRVWTNQAKLAFDATVNLGLESAKFTEVTDASIDALIAEGEALVELTDAEMVAEQAAFELANEQLNVAAAALEAAAAQKILDKEIRDQEKGMSRLVRSFDSFEDSMARSIVSGGNLGDVFADLIRELAAMTVKALILAPLMAAITGGGSVAAGGGGGLIAGIGKFLGFADGGITPGGPIITGERGRELSIPPAGTQIINNKMTEQILGDRTINLVVDGETLATVIERGSELGQNNIALN